MRYLTFTPTHKYKDVFSYVSGFGHRGTMPFIGPWDRNLHTQFLENVILKNDIPETEWPYRNIEPDFYSFNSLGYRTHEFDNLIDNEFDLAIGCSFVEGIGVRKNERWDFHYENYFSRKMINIGKGGSSISAMSYILYGWFLAKRPTPKRIIAIWTEPSRETYVVDNSTPLNYIPTYTSPKHTDPIVATYTKIYGMSVVHPQIWSNRFVQVYNQTNIFAESMNIKMHNYILGDLWPSFSMEVLNEYLYVSPKIIQFNIPCEWHVYYPAADGTHPGPIGHERAFETIKQDIENE